MANDCGFLRVRWCLARAEASPDMTHRETTWILVADDRGARLLRGRTRGSGRTHHHWLERAGALENPWAELERQPDPSRAPGTFEGTRKRTEFLQRWAGELCRWLSERARELGVERLELFAPAGLMSSIRRELTPELSGRIGEHRLDLGRVPHERLENHPAVFELFRSAAS